MRIWLCKRTWPWKNCGFMSKKLKRWGRRMKCPWILPWKFWGREDASGGQINIWTADFWFPRRTWWRDFSAGLDMLMMTCDGRYNLFIWSSSCFWCRTRDCGTWVSSTKSSTLLNDSLSSLFLGKFSSILSEFMHWQLLFWFANYCNNCFMKCPIFN